MPKPSKGFTLIELLLSVALLLIIGGGGMGFYSRFMSQNAAENTRDKIIQVGRKAQMYAMNSRKSNTSGWGIYYSSPTLTLYQGTSYAARNTTWDETYNLEGVTISGLTEINFTRITGAPVPTSASITITGNQGTSKAISMNALGVFSR